MWLPHMQLQDLATIFLKIKKTVLRLFSIYRRLLSYDLSYGLLLVFIEE